MNKEGPDAIIADANALAENQIAQTGNVAAIPVAASSSNIADPEMICGVLLQFPLPMMF